MMRRREILAGIACLGGAACAAALRPRERVSLIGEAQLERLIPARCGAWTMVPGGGVVVPEGDDSLAARLYSQIVTRIYAGPEGAAVMLLVAYGDTQSDLLQLHRPETCYPAFGFDVTRSRLVPVALAGGDALPARFLTARRSDREERILYWTRIGEHLPQSNRAQRLVRLEDQIDGLIPDGVLVRISTLDADDAAAIGHAQAFARAMLGAMTPLGRRALVGSRLAARLGAGGEA